MIRADREIIGDASKAPTKEAISLPVIGDIIGGKFRITGTLGQGGMGVVLEGEHLDLRQAVAIKLLLPALAREPDALARFLREARAAASIKSRHAVRIYDVGTTDTGLPYMVMERLHGKGVDTLIDEQGVLAIEQAVRIVVEGAEAIAEANAVGIVHRDVKPSNLYLATDPSGTEIVKVLDFGISKRITAAGGRESASLTAPQTLLGSPQYMSPEQLRDPRSVDERTDVWGLGVTLFELLTGRCPFECDSIPELCAVIFNSPAVRADALRSAIPAGLADVIERCLAKNAGARTPSVAVLVAQLLPFCSVDVAKSAVKLARSAPFVSVEELGPSAPRGNGADPLSVATSSRRSRRSLFLGATAASVALGAGIFATARGARAPSRSAELTAPAPTSSAPAESTMRNRETLQAAAPDEASASASASPSSSARVEAVAPTSSAALNPLVPRGSASRPPRGLKGIKLID